MHITGKTTRHQADGNGDYVHLACCTCGRIEEYVSRFLDPWKSQIRERHGFRIDVVRFEATGKCRDCARRVEKS